MKHLVIFLSVIFFTLFLMVMNKIETKKENQKKVLRVFGYSSFTNQWGPGPQLKEIFEKTCQCSVDFVEAGDVGILLQRLKIEKEEVGADLVIGLDQYDIDKAKQSISWREFKFDNLNLVNEASLALKERAFLPYDWGILSFVVNKTNFINEKKFLDSSITFDDLLSPELTGQIAFQDPRTSSPGLQLIAWIVQVKGEEEGFRFIEKLMNQAHSFSPTWSSAYGLFTKQQSKMVFSYMASPLYHQIEEKNNDYVSLQFQEGHPTQFEFVGIPEFCKQCKLAEQFVNLLLSNEGQTIIMKKNYMFPVIKGVVDGTPFAEAQKVKTIETNLNLSQDKVHQWLKKWTELRRAIAK